MVCVCCADLHLRSGCVADGELIAEAIGSMAAGTPDEIQIKDASSGLVLHSADLVDTQLHPVECLPQCALLCVSPPSALVQDC